MACDGHAADASLRPAAERERVIIVLTISDVPDDAIFHCQFRRAVAPLRRKWPDRAGRQP